MHGLRESSNVTLRKHVASQAPQSLRLERAATPDFWATSRNKTAPGPASARPADVLQHAASYALTRLWIEVVHALHSSAWVAHVDSRAIGSSVQQPLHVCQVVPRDGSPQVTVELVLGRRISCHDECLSAVGVLPCPLATLP